MPSRYSQMQSVLWFSLSMISLNVIKKGRCAPLVSRLAQEEGRKTRGLDAANAGFQTTLIKSCFILGDNGQNYRSHD